MSCVLYIDVFAYIIQHSFINRMLEEHILE